jgi:hypothetical protein
MYSSVRARCRRICRRRIAVVRRSCVLQRLLLFCFEWECVIEGADAVECAVEPGVGAGARGGGGRRGEYAIEEGRRQGGKDVEARAAIRV